METEALETEANVETQELTQEGTQEVQATEPEVDWRAELEKTKAEAEANIKALQRNLSDRDAKLRAEQERNQRIDEKLDQNAQYTAYLAQLVQTNLPKTDEFGNPIQVPKMDIPTPEQYQAQRYLEQKKQEVREEMAELGLDPVADWNEVYTNSTDPVAAVRYARKLALKRDEERQKAEAEEAKKRQAEEAVKQKRKEAEANGELDMPRVTGTPTNGIPNKPEDMSRYIESLSDEEFKKMKGQLYQKTYGL